jgi:Zn-dependent protease
MRETELSVRLGKVMGIPITIHYAFWLVFIPITRSMAHGYMSNQYLGIGVVTCCAMAIMSAIVLSLLQFSFMNYLIPALASRSKIYFEEVGGQ